MMTDRPCNEGEVGVGEFTLLAGLLQELPRHSEGLLCGVGDDAAVITGGSTRDWIISTDAFIEDIHFRQAWASWAQIGQKAVRAACSDMAAMGGRPRFLLITLALPSTLPQVAIQECYAGLREAAEQLGAMVIGGDTTRSPSGVHIDVVAIGEVGHGKAIYRRGARPGDQIYLTGMVGGARAGLRCLCDDDRSEAAQVAIARHLLPSVRIAAGQWLASTGCVTAMIDISDGLLADLGHIALSSGVGMHLEAIRIPLFAGTTELLRERHCDPLFDAVASGEEYELAFVVARARAAAFCQLLAGAERSLRHPITLIGEVTTGAGVQLLDPAGRVLTPPLAGFEHRFARPA